MFKWIRWSGLIGFVVVVGLLAAFLIFAAGPLARMAIESVGSSVAGAKVEVDDVDFTLSPVGFELGRLTVANSDKPMENLLEFESAAATVDLAPLLMGKGIIRDLSINGLQFSTARTESGALASDSGNDQQDAADDATEENSLADQLSGNLPSAEEILARENLYTQAAGEAFKETFDRRQQQLDDALAAVPDQQRLDEYQQQVKAITSGKITSLEDFNQRKQQLQALRDQFKADKKAVNTAKDLIGETRVEVTGRLQDLKDAPAKDIASIKDKYQLNATGAANLSGLLFGDEAGEWATQALFWYEKIKPYLASGSDEAEEEEYLRPDGRYVHFPTDDPWPEFLIRHTAMSASTSAGDLAITGTDLTHQQRVLGRPARIDIDGQGLRTVDALNANITLDHTRSPSRDTMTLDATGWQLDSVNLGLGDTQLERASADMQGMAQVVTNSDGDQLTARLEGQFGNTEFSSTGNTTFAKELTAALQTINSFDIDARANGALQSPSIEFGSNLDSQLSSAFNQRLKAQQDKLEARLQGKLDDKINEFAGPYADQLKALNNDDQKLTDKLAQLEDMGRAELDNYVDQQKQQAKEKAAEKAKDKLKSLF
ncbi:TIGR03545 family protein [Oceanobacter kriegii]|uniref:TIGR03545 family protein n=1 Tax=Oceanobacter kriegii TaxID=64972 RepID=UPI000409F530|nr:TIGR03545 family protein [Oceanobacter kriegii]